MKTRQLMFGLILSAGVLSAGTSAFAQTTPRPESPIVTATKQVTEANTALTAAKAANETARLKVIATFKTTNPDYAKAEDELAKAKKDMEAAKLAAQAAARATPEYKNAVLAKMGAQEKLRAAAGDSTGVGDAAMKDFTTQASILNRLDASALENPKYLEAKTKYLEAQKAVEAYKIQIDTACANDPEYQQVNQNFVAAQAAVVTAQENLKTVRTADAEARKAARTTTVRPGPAPKN